MNEQQAEKLRGKCKTLVSLYTIEVMLNQEIRNVVSSIARDLGEIEKSEAEFLEARK